MLKPYTYDSPPDLNDAIKRGDFICVKLKNGTIHKGWAIADPSWLCYRFYVNNTKVPSGDRYVIILRFCINFNNLTANLGKTSISRNNNIPYHEFANNLIASVKHIRHIIIEKTHPYEKGYFETRRLY